jgi:uncharacterized protein DUF11/slime mold repeat-containing protein
MDTTTSRSMLTARRSIAALLRAVRREMVSVVPLPILASALLLVLTSPPAQAIPWPPTGWIGIGACGENEPAGDETPKSTDLVGAPGFPAAFFQMDASYLYLRERVFGNPAGSGGVGFDQFAWVSLVQTIDGDPFKYQWLISLDGKAAPQQVELWSNNPSTAQDISFSPIFNDPADTKLFSGDATDLARAVAADSSIGGQQNYFVDFAVPLSTLSSNGINPTTSLYWFATSANGNNFNKDTTACPFVPGTSLNLTKGVAPGTVSTNQTTPVTYTITVTNSGTFLARGVVLSDSDFPAWLTITNVTTSIGTVSASTTSSFEVRIPTLTIGQSATITVTANAAPTSVGNFTNTVSAFASNASSTSASATLIANPATPTPTRTATPTLTKTPTITATLAASSTPTHTATSPPTHTPTLTPTSTTTPTSTPSSTPSATSTPTSVCPALNCDDGNDCTEDSCDPAVGCQHANAADGIPCSDGNACTSDDTCSAGECVGGAAPSCDDGNLCTDDACDPGRGCTHTNNSNPCDDANACTTNDTCSGGTCVGGAPLDCSDGNVCTDDSCDPTSGCTHTDNTAPCSDNNACTTNDTCSGGACLPGAPLDCDDRNLCTDDSCNPASGCVHTNNNAACDDGNACTTGDFCSGGTCAGGPPPNCNDNNVCTDDSCNPASGCTHSNNTAACSDGNACTSNDVCSGGTCVSGPALNCNDGNACTTDSCNPALGCQNPPLTNCQPCSTSADCDNHNACDGAEACVAGKCQAGAPLHCDDGNVCTDDACNPASGCTHTNNNASCDDGNACTTADSCSGGRCAGGPPPNCNDGNVCTTDGCNPGSGCTHTNNTNACDDGNACTTNDTCGGGRCVGGSPPHCNDGNPCTADSCDPLLGCQAPPVANGTTCSDSLACNGVERCEAGICVPGTPVDCSGLGNQCNYGTCVEPSGTCAATPKIDGFACNDGNACTINDRCKSGVCIAGVNSGDSDGDGYCDAQEVAAQCNPDDPREIPSQPNVFAGGRIQTRGQILLTYATPSQRDIDPATDASCAAAGACNPVTHFCTSGRIADPCGADSDCTPAVNTCRIVINYAAVPDLTLSDVTWKVRRHPRISLLADFLPATPGCSRKVDVQLPLPGFKRANLRLKAKGTTGIRVGRDRDWIRYKELPPR